MEIIAIIVSVLVGIPSVYFSCKQYRKSKKSKTEKIEIEYGLISLSNTTALKRIQNSKSIRCAFTEYAPFSFIDTKTGEVSGIAIDILNQIAKRLEVKIEWVESALWSNMIDGLNEEKYDIVTYVWKTKSRETLASFILPFHSSRIGIIVRKDDSRFPDNLSFEMLLETLNNKSVKICAIKKEISEILSNTLFPKATLIYIEHYSNIYQLLNELTKRTSDVAFVEPFLLYNFDKKYPDELKNIAENCPIIQPGSFMIKKGEDGLRDVLNFILIELLEEGIIKNIFQNYELESGLLSWEFNPKMKGILL